MKYSLDTNTCIRVINQRSPQARTKLLSTPAQEVVVCSVVRAELFYGAAKSQTPEQTRKKQELFLQAFKSLAFDDNAASIYGRIRAELERAGTPIGPLDMQIAAIVLAHNLILITHNTREFSRISGLTIQDWENSD
jgi:tRNA(fMet)-specific endonuclease VapC